MRSLAQERSGPVAGKQGGTAGLFSPSLILGSGFLILLPAGKFRPKDRCEE